MKKATRWPEAHKAALATWQKQGKTDEQIGRLIGRTEDAVREMRSKTGAVKYQKRPYTQKNPRKNGKRSGKKVVDGTALPLFESEKSFNQRKQNNVTITDALRDNISKDINRVIKNAEIELPTFKEDFANYESGTGEIHIYAGSAISAIGYGLTPRQAARIMIQVINRLV